MMRLFRCKCGNVQARGSARPNPCDGCSNCGTNLAETGEAHNVPQPHQFEMAAAMLETGMVVRLSRCVWCGAHEQKLFPRVQST